MWSRELEELKFQHSHKSKVSLALWLAERQSLLQLWRWSGQPRMLLQTEQFLHICRLKQFWCDWGNNWQTLRKWLHTCLWWQVDKNVWRFEQYQNSTDLYLIFNSQCNSFNWNYKPASNLFTLLSCVLVFYSVYIFECWCCCDRCTFLWGRRSPLLLHSICIQCVGIWRMCKYDGTEWDGTKQNGTEWNKTEWNRTEWNDQTKDIVSHQHGLLISRMSCGAVRWPTNPQKFLCAKKRDKMYWGAMNSVQEKSGRANCMGHKCQSRVDKRPSTNLKLSWPPISTRLFQPPSSCHPLLRLSSQIYIYKYHLLNHKYLRGNDL